MNECRRGLWGVGKRAESVPPVPGQLRKLQPRATMPTVVGGQAVRSGRRGAAAVTPFGDGRPVLLYKPAWRAGLARDRLTPTGQARGIGMRKYSKILGAFSMSLASLLSFVEACHAQGSPVTAIDILLEPDATMVQHAQADNGRLLKACPDGFALDATHHPHITMLQQFVRTADLGKVHTAANRILGQRESDKLEPEGVQVLPHPCPAKRHCGHWSSEPTAGSTPAATGAYWMRLRLSQRGPKPLPHS